MSDVAKEEIAAMLDRCGSKLVERLVADPVFDTVRQHMPRGTKSTLVCVTPIPSPLLVMSFHNKLTPNPPPNTAV